MHISTRASLVAANFPAEKWSFLSFSKRECTYMKDLFAKIVGRRNFQKKPPEGEEYVNIITRMSVKYLSK